MNKILALQKALNDLGVETRLIKDLEAQCFDRKVHRGIELETNIFDGEDNVSFIFHPDTHQLVKSWLDCPIV